MGLNAVGAVCGFSRFEIALSRELVIKVIHDSVASRLDDCR